ncbi:MAG: hypothetical protein WKG52_12805 [Variovorax sp.]
MRIVYVQIALRRPKDLPLYVNSGIKMTQLNTLLNAESLDDLQGETKRIQFDRQQAALLQYFSEQLAALGGPQKNGVQAAAALAATELKLSFSPAQHQAIKSYSDGTLSLLVFEGLKEFSGAALPAELPSLPILEIRHDILCLAARSQIQARGSSRVCL